MIIENLITEFYNTLIGNKILVIVNYDVDAICACKILQSLFQYDTLLYSVVPILGRAALNKAYAENKENTKNIIFINCGGCIDLITELEPDDGVTFFVCDSHRPLDVSNIYNTEQIKLIGDSNLLNEIPPFEKIFNDSEDEDEDDPSDEDSDLPAHERLEKRANKRRAQRIWQEERDRILFDYTQYEYYGKSSALTFFELSWKLSKDSINLLWCAIVGITEQLLMGKIESSNYALETAGALQSHVSRLLNKNSDSSEVDSVNLTYENDLHLALYRHWSINESLKHSIYPSSKLRLWTIWGEKKLHELLVEMGLPLVQAAQTFITMDLTLKNEFHKMIESLVDKYNLSELIYGSFTLQFGFGNKFSAADYVYSIIANMEIIGRDRTIEYCFLQALEGLTQYDCKILDEGIKNAKQLLIAVYKQIQSSFEMRMIKKAGPYLYHILNEENLFFSSPYGILMLAKFILSGYVSIVGTKDRHATQLPLIVGSLIDAETGVYLMIGIPPTCEDTKNFFGTAFEQAAHKSKISISQDFFDKSIMQIKQSDIPKFLDSLTTLLT